MSRTTWTLLPPARGTFPFPYSLHGELCFAGDKDEAAGFFCAILGLYPGAHRPAGWPVETCAETLAARGFELFETLDEAGDEDYSEAEARGGLSASERNQ